MRVQIPTPCHEDWQAMTPATQGRHCAACAKTVVDFTAMSDAEILHQLRHASGQTCGRFRGSQLARKIGDPLPVPGVLAQAAPHVVRAALVIGGLGIAVDTANAQMGAPALIEEVEKTIEAPQIGEVAIVEDPAHPQPKICATGANASVISLQDTVPPQVMGMVAPYRKFVTGDTTVAPEGLTALKSRPTAKAGFKWVSGTVVDALTGETLIGATVHVKDGAIGTISDFDGVFELEVPEDVDSLAVVYVGYLNQVIAVGGSGDTTRLSHDVQMLEGLTGTVGYYYIEQSPWEKAMTFVRTSWWHIGKAFDRLVEAFTPSAADPEAFGGLYLPVAPSRVSTEPDAALLYPNPSGTSVTLELPVGTAPTLINVYNALGELVFAIPVSGQTKVDMALPSSATGGTYQVQGTNATGNISFTLPWIVIID